MSTGNSAGTEYSRQVNEPPASHLGAVTQVEVFGQGVVFPAAAVDDGHAAPNAGCAVEIEETAGTIARGVFDDEVAVQKDRLQGRDQGKRTVEMGPAHLHHADLRVGEIVDGVLQEIFVRYEIGVENGDEFAFGLAHAFGQGTGLESFAVGAVQVMNIVTLFLVLLHFSAGDAGGFIG